MVRMSPCGRVLGAQSVPRAGLGSVFSLKGLPVGRGDGTQPEASQSVRPQSTSRELSWEMSAALSSQGEGVYHPEMRQSGGAVMDPQCQGLGVPNRSAVGTRRSLERVALGFRAGTGLELLSSLFPSESPLLRQFLSKCGWRPSCFKNPWRC